MAMHNFGVIKATFTNYMNESENLHAKEMFGKFMQLIKEEKILRSEFEVYKNLENKYIPNENLAIKYIDECINLFSDFNISTYNASNNKIAKLVEGLDVRVSPKKQDLYSHIDTLIFESLSPEPNIDYIHESFTYVLEHVKTNKPKLIESDALGGEFASAPKEFLIKRAIEKFNERYSSLSESDRSILKSIISDNASDKQTIFTSLKEDTLKSLTSLIGDNQQVNEKVNESIKKINTMSFNGDTYSKDVLSLSELKSSITQ